MECVLQWLDDLDDIVSAVALKAESLRRIALGCLTVSVALIVLTAVIVTAQRFPDVAAAAAALLLAALIYRRGSTPARPDAAH